MSATTTEKSVSEKTKLAVCVWINAQTSLEDVNSGFFKIAWTCKKVVSLFRER